MIFSDETLKENAGLLDSWLEKAKDMEMEKFRSTVVSGFKVKPVYTPEDIKDLDYSEISLPGEYPYTRGYWPAHYQKDLPLVGQQMSLQSTDETNERIELLEKTGRRARLGADEEDDSFSMVLAIDLPSQLGFDPDDPVSEGKVGECAMSISTMDDYVELFKNMPSLDKVPTFFVAFNAAEFCVAAASVYCEDYRKEPLSDLIVFPADDHICQHYYDILTYPPKAGIKMRAELTKYLVENCPNSAGNILDGYNVAETGANSDFEMAIAFTQAIATAEECVTAGLDPNDFMGRFHTHLHLGINMFEEIAKLRATRKIWANIAKERFGCTEPEAFKLREYVTQNSAMDTIALEPLNNIIRITIMTMVGFLADLDGIHPIAYDEPLGIPTDESIRISQRTLQILAEETDIPYVTDPLGGSYYIEWLTKKMEERILKNMKDIEDRGGFIKCLESGWLRAEVARQAAEKHKKLKDGSLVKVGYNKYKVEDSPPPINVIRRPIEVEEKILEKVKKYKAGRNQENTKKALSELRKAAEAIDKDWPNSAGVYMPALVEAIRAKATLGECVKVSRDVFGFGYWAK